MESNNEINYKDRINKYFLNNRFNLVVNSSDINEIYI